MAERQFTRHPASEVLPDLSDEEYNALKASIETDGFQAEILLHEGQIVDGWHRQLVAYELDVEPSYRDLGELEPEEIAGLVIGLHEGRRHLTPAERATVNIKIKRACGIPFAKKGGDHQSNVSNDTLVEIKREDVAKEAGVSEPTAQRAISEVKREEAGEDAPEKEYKPTRLEQVKTERDMLREALAASETRRDEAEERIAIMTDGGDDPNMGPLQQAKQNLARMTEDRDKALKLRGQLKFRLGLIQKDLLDGMYADEVLQKHFGAKRNEQS